MHKLEQNYSRYSLAVWTTVPKISKKILFVLVNEKYLFFWARQHLHIFSINWLTAQT